MNEKKDYIAIERLLQKKKLDDKLSIEYYIDDKNSRWSIFLKEFDKLLVQIENNDKYSNLYNRFLNIKQNFISDLLELKTLIYLLKNGNWVYEPDDNSPDFINKESQLAFEVKASSLSMLCDFFYSKAIEFSHDICIDKDLFLDIRIKSKQNNLQEALLNGKNIKNEFKKLFGSIYDFIKANKEGFTIGYKEENNEFILRVDENKAKSHPNISIRLFDFQQVLSSEEITDSSNFTIYERQWVNTLKKAIDKKIETGFKLNVAMGTFRKDDLKNFINSDRFIKFSGIDIKKVSKIYLIDLYKIRENGLDYTEL